MHQVKLGSVWDGEPFVLLYQFSVSLHVVNCLVHHFQRDSFPFLLNPLPQLILTLRLPLSLSQLHLDDPHMFSIGFRLGEQGG